jgi:hypothetical protein
MIKDLITIEIERHRQLMSKLEEVDRAATKNEVLLKVFGKDINHV